MNYRLHYDRLMQRALSRARPHGYCERHHVIPICVGGSRGASNCVILTAREHYVAHQLLTKIYPGHRGLLFAAISMAGDGKRGRSSNKLYAWLRERYARATSLALKGKPKSPEATAKMIAALTGRKIPPEIVERSASKRRGRKASIAHRTNIAKALLGKKNPERGPAIAAALKGRTLLRESIEKRSAKQRGLKRSDEVRAQISVRMKGRVVSRESIEKRVAKLKDRPLSSEHRAKLSQALRGRKCSPETKARMSAAVKSRWANAGALERSKALNALHKRWGYVHVPVGP